MVGHYIGINNLFLENEPTGVSNYAKSITMALFRINPWIKSFSSVDIIPATIKTPDFDTSRGLLNNILRVIYYESLFKRKLGTIKVLYSPTVEIPITTPMKRVITIHDLFPLKYPGYYGFFSYYFAFVLKQAIKNPMITIVATSESTKKEILKVFKGANKEIYVSSEGCDEKDFFPRDEDNKALILERYKINVPYFLYVGNMHYPYKNVQFLIDVFCELKTHFQMILCGKGSEYIRVPQSCQNVKILGYIPGEDLPYLYSYAYALVFPSLDEGFGLPALEAIACGCPVIASEIAALKDILGDAGIYFDPRNKPSLAEALKAVINKPSLRDHLKREGLERRKLYSWEKSAEIINNVLIGRTNNSVEKIS